MPSDDSLLIPPVVATAARPTQEEIDAYNKENPDQDVMAYGNIVKSGSPSGSIAPTQEEYRNVHGAQIPIDPETDGVLYPITHGLAPMLYGAAKGTVAGTLGIPGDLNELLRKYVVPYEPTIVQDILHNMPDVFPTSEDVSKVVPSITQALDMDKTAQGSEEYGDFAGKNVVTGLEGPKLLGKVAGKAIEATKDLPVGLSIKDVSPSAPEGNLNFTPRITESHFTGPDEQPIQDLLAKAKQIPGVTKEGLANATESLRTYDPKTKMSKAEFVSHITPSKYSKELLTEPGPTAREEDYMMQGARDNVDRRDVIEDMGVPRGAMLNELTDLYDGDIAWNDLDPATKRHLSEIGIHDLNAFHEHFYDAEHELVMNWYNDIAHDHGFQNQGDYRYTGQQRVVPTAHPDYGKGYFELGVTHPHFGADSGEYGHYSRSGDPANMIGHVRGTHIKEPMTIDNTVGEPITLPPNTVVVEEVQSDVAKHNDEVGSLHQVHGVLTKAAIQHAAEQGADYIAIPNSRMIGFPDNRMPKNDHVWSAGTFHTLMDSEIPKTAINDAKKIPGVTVITDATQMPGHKWTQDKLHDWMKGMGINGGKDIPRNIAKDALDRVIKELASSVADVPNRRVYSDLGAPLNTHGELEGYLQGRLEFGDLSRTTQDFLSEHNYTRKAFREEVASMKHAIYNGYTKVHPSEVLDNLGIPSYAHDDIIKFVMDEKPFDALDEEAKSWLREMYVKKVGVNAWMENTAHHTNVLKDPTWFQEIYNRVEDAARQSKSKFGSVSPQYMELLKSKGYDLHTEEGRLKFAGDLAKVRDQRDQELTDIYNNKEYQPYTILHLSDEAKEHILHGKGQRTPGYKKGGAVKMQEGGNPPAIQYDLTEALKDPAATATHRQDSFTAVSKPQYAAEETPTLLQQIAERTHLQISGSSKPGERDFGGFASYYQPIDQNNGLQFGVSGHAAKGHGWSDTGIDSADVKFVHRFANGGQFKPTNIYNEMRLALLKG